MKTLITGATGFLGYWMTKRLIDEGREVRALVRRPGEAELIKGLGAELVEGDILSPDQLRSAVKGVDSVFHLAGLIAYKRSDRSLMERVNVGGTKNVIDAVLDQQGRSGSIRMLHFSSVAAIGAGFTPNEVLDEASHFNLAHLDLGYFETKHQAEKLIIDAVKSKGLDCGIINPATVYGPMDSLKGSRGTQLKVARGRFPFNPPGGVNVVHVDDVIELAMRIFKSPSRGARVIAASENLLIRDLFRRIARIAHVTPPKYRLSKSMIHGLGFMGDQLERVGLKGPVNSETAWTSTLFHWFNNRKATDEFGVQFQAADVAIESSIRWSRDNGRI